MKTRTNAPTVLGPECVRCAWRHTAEPNLTNGAGWPVWPLSIALPFFREHRNSYATP